jgi:hypothetical protein
MEVHQTRGDDLACDINDLFGSCYWYLWGQANDSAICNGDIHGLVKALSGIDDSATLQEQVTDHSCFLMLNWQFASCAIHRVRFISQDMEIASYLYNT